MRDSGLLWPASCAKKRPETMRFAHALAALSRLPFAWNAASPFAERSAFNRQRIAPESALRFAGSGLAEVLEQATPPATPCVWASVGRFSFGEIGPVLPTVFAPCSSTVVAGPSRPLVGTAWTTPPPPGVGLAPGAGAFGLLPPPPPQAASASAEARAA